MPPEAIRGNQRPSEAIRSYQEQPEAIRSNQRPSEAIGSNQKQSEAIGSAPVKPLESNAGDSRRAVSSKMGACSRVRARALKVITRGRDCVDCGGTVAQPQLMRRRASLPAVG